MAIPQRILDAGSIVGVGESRHVKRSGKSTNELLIEACKNAMDDAGIDPKEIDGVIVADERVSFKPHKFEIEFGLKQRRFHAMSPWYGGCNQGWSITMACMAIAEGLANNVICYMGRASVTERENWDPRKVHADDPYKSLMEVPFGWFPQPVYFATYARRHMIEYGTKEEHLGKIAVAMRLHASKNSNAVVRDAITLGDYFASPYVAEPLRRPDCCLINDGAAAVVVSRRNSERDFRKEPIRVIGASEAHEPGLTHWPQRAKYTETTAGLTTDAFAAAGIRQDEIDFAVIYDCFTSTLMLQIEDLGFCKKGEVGDYIDSVGVDINSKMPINPHGGLLAQSYVQGMNHIVEAVRQLRGEADLQVEGANLGVYSGFGDTDHSTLILAKG